jgi:hypothetical protein
MGFKFTFLTGFVAGYVVGAAAGRERYEQIKGVSSKVAGHPAVQKATGTVGAKATELSKTAKDKAADKLPRFAAAAVSKAGGNPDKIPGVGGHVNGSSDYGVPAPDTYNPPPGTAS